MGLWPLPPQTLIVELATAGGPIRNYLIPESLEVQVVEPDKCSKVVKADAIISNIEDEVLVNDILSEELGIVLWELLVESGDLWMTLRVRCVRAIHQEFGFKMTRCSVLFTLLVII